MYVSLGGRDPLGALSSTDSTETRDTCRESKSRRLVTPFIAVQPQATRMPPAEICAEDELVHTLGAQLSNAVRQRPTTALLRWANAHPLCAICERQLRLKRKRLAFAEPSGAASAGGSCFRWCQLAGTIYTNSSAFPMCPALPGGKVSGEVALEVLPLT